MGRTEEGTVLGTASYMSPEQAEGRKIDARTDIFSFGAVLYEMLSGQRAFRGDSKVATLSAILREEPKPLAELGVAVPPEMERLVIRCLRKDPERRTQIMKDVRIALEELKDESDSGKLLVKPIAERIEPPHEQARKAAARAIPWAGAAVLLLTGVGLFWVRQNSQRAPAPTFTLRQITQDAGYTGEPAISRDGKLVAYASDRAGDTGTDIWVQQLATGSQPIRLTRHAGDERDPSFSPDGGQIVFSSSKEGGGLYLIPALGGEERLLIRGSFRRPRFSRDGQMVVTFRAGSSSSTDLLIVPVSGGPARALVEDFRWKGWPVWSPDGRSVLFAGWKDDERGVDWWIVPAGGGAPKSVGAAAMFPAGSVTMPGLSAPIGRFPVPAEWIDNYVLYAAGSLFRLEISEAGTAWRPPERLTYGSANELSPAAVDSGAPGAWKIVFASGSDQRVLRRQSLDPNSGKLHGSSERLIPGRQDQTTPSVSADGLKLAYVLQTLSSFALRLRQLDTGKETTLIQMEKPFRAKISPDGLTVAYNPSLQDESEKVIRLVSTDGGESRELCNSCGLIYDWTPDAHKLNYRTGRPVRFEQIEIESREQSVILSDPKYDIHAAKYSPDGHWIALHYSPSNGPRGIFVAPLRDGKAAPRSEWVRLMDRPGVHSRPWWSPDGNSLYFLSTARGDWEIWRQPLDRRSKGAAGAMETVLPSHAAGGSLVTGTTAGPGAGRNFLIYLSVESTGNIWLAE